MTVTRFGLALLAAAVLTLPTAASAVSQTAKPPKAPHYEVLVVTAGDKKAGVNDAGVKALRAIGLDGGSKADPDATFSIDLAQDASQINDKFAASHLGHYNTVVFLDTAAASLLSDAQKAAFEAYYHDGGGFLGIGSAIQTEPAWPFFTEILGARAATALSAAAAAGDTNVKVDGVGGLAAGKAI